jgi:hypothetical protein
VAQAIVALIENGFVTGVVFPCDGGLRLTGPPSRAGRSRGSAQRLSPTLPIIIRVPETRRIASPSGQRRMSAARVRESPDIATSQRADLFLLTQRDEDITNYYPYWAGSDSIPCRPAHQVLYEGVQNSAAAAVGRLASVRSEVYVCGAHPSCGHVQPGLCSTFVLDINIFEQR